jgi:6-phosphofructokinase 1
VLASRSGVAAVERLMAQGSGEMVGQVNGKLKFTPFHEVLGQRKQLEDELLRILAVLSI